MSARKRVRRYLPLFFCIGCCVLCLVICGFAYFVFNLSLESVVSHIRDELPSRVEFQSEKRTLSIFTTVMKADVVVVFTMN